MYIYLCVSFAHRDPLISNKFLPDRHVHKKISSSLLLIPRQQHNTQDPGYLYSEQPIEGTPLPTLLTCSPPFIPFQLGLSRRMICKYQTPNKRAPVVLTSALQSREQDSSVTIKVWLASTPRQKHKMNETITTFYTQLGIGYIILTY